MKPKDHEFLAQAYGKIKDTVINEKTGSRQFVLILIDVTEFEVFGIYSDENIAWRALQTMQKEEGESRFGSRYELKRVPLNQEPGYNYIPNE